MDTGKRKLRRGMAGGGPGALMVSQVATGEENALAIKVCDGFRGMLFIEKAVHSANEGSIWVYL